VENLHGVENEKIMDKFLFFFKTLLGPMDRMLEFLMACFPQAISTLFPNLLLQ